jgi:hypothetical protein
VATMLQQGKDDIPSQEVIRCFSNCIVDPNGKIVARTGYHDEDLILTGHGNRILDLMGPPPAYLTREKSPSEDFREQLARSGFKSVQRPQSGWRGPVDIAKW